ncbi:SEL1-like repeat protein [Thorsellia kenyensis]|uniref:DUF6396 domain-containing protein n=1 Tax=Thorsellia kenyensis TaxID=1549888 RepID=A0ABV6C9W1_9GAMM
MTTYPVFTLESDKLFKETRALQKKHRYSSEADDRLVVGYRHAAEQGHIKAMINLQNLLIEGKGVAKEGMTHGEEALYWVEHLMSLNVASGFYQMGFFLSRGFMVERDVTKGLAYYRRAADLGNKEAQAKLGDIFASKRLINYTKDGVDNPAYRPEIGRAMLKCAAEQGHHEAARRLGSDYRIDKIFDKSAEAYQIGARHGGLYSVRALIHGFSITKPSDGFYLGQAKVDEERVRRYEIIAEKIRRNENFKFPDIDKIVPLPPAKLPEWDGTFEYEKTAQDNE